MNLIKDLIVLGIDTIDPNKFQEVKNSRSRNKPIGGLWTSPIDSIYGWKDFVKIESYKKEKYLSKFVLLSLKDSAKILKIDSAKDFDEAPKRYIKGENDWYPPIKYLDFEEIAKSYDALWLTYNGVKELSYCLGDDAFIGDLYGWDVETVLLFNLNCIENHA